MSGTENNQDQFDKLTANTSKEPFVILNLLKFKEQGGRESYLRYMKESAPYVEAVGAKVTFFGRANELLSGEETWDIIMIVHYPSRKAYLEMINNPGYLKVHEYRLEALERSVLYAADPIGFKDVLVKPGS